MERYIRKLVLTDLRQRHVDDVLKRFRKLPWQEEKVGRP